MQNYDLAIAGDHRSVELKQEIIDFLQQRKLEILNLGTNDHDVVDYPDYAQKVVEEIIENNVKYGILICGTGIGMSIAANRSSNIRAALCTSELMAERARMHNDANILILGSKIVSSNLALKMVDKFLNTDFEGGRHVSRLDKIT